jgi:predicted nucleic-acid-binding Zn-ribbon protein
MMKEKQWIVVRCRACRICHGSNGNFKKCPHCGNVIGENAEIVSTVNSETELRMEVAIANTPEELRGTLRKKLHSKKDLVQNLDPPAFTMAKWVHQSADENGEVTIHSVTTTIESKNTDIDAEDLISMAETQGMLLRIGENRWTLLE